MFGNAQVSPQDENTPFNPRSIYGISKVAGYHLVKNYRSQYGMFACTGILYNHESPRRGYEFVTRKIIAAAVNIKLGSSKPLVLGNLDASRDWGYAPDYVRAMWLMLQANTPDDYVVATGETHRVRDFVEMAFSSLGLDYQQHVRVDQNLFRATENVPLCGNAAKAAASLGWSRTFSFNDIIRSMIDAEMSEHCKQEP